MKNNLNKVTLLAVDCVNCGAAITALRKSMEQCDFACVKLLTDIPLNLTDINVVNIPHIKSKEQYSEFMIKELTSTLIQILFWLFSMMAMFLMGVVGMMSFTNTITLEHRGCTRMGKT
jgi:hypothetical protein